MNVSHMNSQNSFLSKFFETIRTSKSFGLTGVHHGSLSPGVSHLVFIVLLPVLAALHALVVSLRQLVILVLGWLGSACGLRQLLFDCGGRNFLDIFVVAHSRPLDAWLDEGAGARLTGPGHFRLLSVGDPAGFGVVGGAIVLTETPHSESLSHSQEGVEVVLLDVDLPVVHEVQDGCEVSW